MKRLLIVSLMLVAFVIAQAQEKLPIDVKDLSRASCYGSGVVEKSFIAPPEAFSKRLKSTDGNGATINVEYVNFPEDAQAAFDYAVGIWESLLKSPITINMNVTWEDLDEGVLGNCTPSNYYENFDAAPLADTYYPIALVEKLEGKEITDASSPDIFASFSSDVNWYFGIDGNTPIEKYDFVTVVLHEITHGLGFTGMIMADEDIAGYGYIEYHPGVFDRNVVNQDQEHLTDTSLFENPSSELYEEITSNYLLYKSETAKSFNEDDSYPRLYAPTTYDEGSSVYHLNEYTYMSGNSNSLMTPQIGQGEAIHDPGAFVLGIFADMGWEYTSISHDHLKDMEAVSEPIEMSAEIISDTELDSTSVVLHFTSSEFENEEITYDMTYDSSTDLFITMLPALPDGNYKYYISAADTSETTYSLPARAPEEYFSFVVGEDTTTPELSHDPVVYMLESNQFVDIDVTATDNLGIKDVEIEYIINDQSPNEKLLTAGSNDLYTTQLSFDGLVDGDSIRYRIIATDASSNANTYTLPEPEEGYFTFYVEGLYEPVTIYENDFDSESRDFISDDFSIYTGENFDNGALHSPHPYLSPETEDGSYNYVTMLKYPIILTANTKMRYKEVVLVEPGESGTDFKDVEFWDYVIVEGSKNGEDNWLPLIDGYDSGDNVSWSNYYVQNISGNNSEADGNKSYFRQREINLTENGHFAVEDTIYIRFRLYSDPYAHGWGWVIDNLLIKEIETGISLEEESAEDILIYPNPVEESLNISGLFNGGVKKVEVFILNSTGLTVYRRSLDVSGNILSESLDLGSLSSGFYFVTIRFEDGKSVTKRIVKR